MKLLVPGWRHRSGSIVDEQKDTTLTSRLMVKNMVANYIRSGRESQVSFKQKGEGNPKGDSEEAELIRNVICRYK